MVKFELVASHDGIFSYYDYPEGNFELKPGIIKLDVDGESIRLVELAEKDFEWYVTAEELNELIKSLNDMIAENGGVDFEEYVAEGYTRRSYGDHAISGILEGVKDGIPPETGMRAWY